MALKSISREAEADGSRRKRKRAGDVCEYVSERLSGRLYSVGPSCLHKVTANSAIPDYIVRQKSVCNPALRTTDIVGEGFRKQVGAQDDDLLCRLALVWVPQRHENVD